MQPHEQWRGPERRLSRSQGPWQGAERRRSHSGGYTDTTVDAEPPMDEQEERELAQERGPNPRK
jgi:hypothetical protein